MGFKRLKPGNLCQLSSLPTVLSSLASDILSLGHLLLAPDTDFLGTLV